MSSNRRPPRDPAAPKRNMSAYLLYQNAMRDTFKQQNPGMTFGQLSKYTSAMYAEMPPAEKEAWNQRAEADKARYLHELANYVPPPGYDVKGDAIATHATHTAPKRRGGGASANKTSRDPNAPKRNMSAYLLYQNCMREQFKAQNPGMTFGQLAKYTSHMYKCLSLEEKNRWEAHAAQDKARYEAEMTTYVPPPGYDATGNLVEDRRLNKKYMKKQKDPDQPKRARGSFVFFTFDMRPKVMEEYPGIKFVDMGVVLGERWRALPAAEKQKYEEMAQEDKQRFNKEMEEYSAKRVAAEPPAPVVPENRGAYAVAAHAAGASAAHAAYHPDPHAQGHYDHAAAAAHHAYYADPNAAYYADPNAQHADPYGQHAVYYQQGGQQYHYA
mmetsp:Transcript_43562/g.92618  ORF Transcript_43562/g.92618 Transcript_43562/m.92618 type:complete len:384 (-) Transcript_43562:268-1419(-)|eukprot:CAMPEP_0172574776 /NCGR_PEP_ID=MMETSP1067-20121228/136869_1 /TAXON_ID=265564 ORGANISM="Thalassiosira punctigera, Strain Tpunct2005C2" /NCGR_SAMPLE_ID=MMETSP1067 /ASSEMBLY_ACC=CAM_ASM_000444 /LENGTH=383 /DNA_ID=CAMNT_0013367409 /DNA_START=490 /DNA_END=1641 /DNA_ORIENTATION=-